MERSRLAVPVQARRQRLTHSDEGSHARRLRSLTAKFRFRVRDRISCSDRCWRSQRWVSGSGRAPLLNLREVSAAAAAGASVCTLSAAPAPSDNAPRLAGWLTDWLTSVPIQTHRSRTGSPVKGIFSDVPPAGDSVGTAPPTVLPFRRAFVKPLVLYCLLCLSGLINTEVLTGFLTRSSLVSGISVL